MGNQLLMTATSCYTNQDMIRAIRGQSRRTTVEEQWYTVEEVAERVKVSQETVRRWIRRGRLRAVLLGGTRLGYRITQSDLQGFLQGSRREQRRGELVA